MLDAANGVGAGRVSKLLEYIGDLVDIQIFNDGSSGKLNFMVSQSGLVWLSSFGNLLHIVILDHCFCYTKKC